MVQTFIVNSAITSMEPFYDNMAVCWLC